VTNQSLTDYAASLGYDLSEEDCEEIRATSYDGETVADAVDDYLRAYEA